MPKMTTQTQARPLFAARLTPHRSLGRRGFRVVLAIMAIGVTVPAIAFYSLGAWPVVIANLVTLALASAILVMKLRYR